MPTYDYTCDSCGKTHEIVHKMNEPARTECPSCHKMTLRKSYTPAPLHFKGNGFYITDYSNKSSPVDKGCQSGCGCHKPQDKKPQP